MKKCKGISLMLAAMLLAQSCVVPAMASDTDTYPQENGYYVETAPEDEVVTEEEDPQYWARPIVGRFRIPSWRPMGWIIPGLRHGL